MAAGIEGNSSHSGSDDFDALFPPSFSSWREGTLSCEAEFPIKVDGESFFFFLCALHFCQAVPQEEDRLSGKKMSLSNRLLLWKNRADRD